MKCNDRHLHVWEDSLHLITLFKSITLLCGIDSSLHNIHDSQPECWNVPHNIVNPTKHCYKTNSWHSDHGSSIFKSWQWVLRPRFPAYNLITCKMHNKHLNHPTVDFKSVNLKHLSTSVQTKSILLNLLLHQVLFLPKNMGFVYLKAIALRYQLRSNLLYLQPRRKI